MADYLVVALCIWLTIGVSWWFYPPAIVLIGSTQRALVNLLHESSHKVLTRNQSLNVFLGTIPTGYLVLHLYNPYRNTHIGFHHRFLGDPERDPDYVFHRENGLYDHNSTNFLFFVKNALFAFIGLRSITYLRFVFRDRLLFKSDNVSVSMPVRLGTERVMIGLTWAVIVSVCAALDSLHLLLLFWIVPLLTSYVVIGWFSELAEHFPLPESENGQVLLTRNRHGWAVERYLFGRHHDCYHLVHHLNTGIPFWNMKRAHRALLADDGYRMWDSMWGGIFTRSRSRPGTETLISYTSKYRMWRRGGGSLEPLPLTFAQYQMIAARPGNGEAPAADGTP
ncbi:fatty acid desaturase family protein [Streptomyces sp. PRKS01-29]|nr:fatty acid desaturase family protein [Streptomyces sabulosicollis]MBI0293373.1 fatty acid desaturase family protein [Streptomyces sabulosicollis]